MQVGGRALFDVCCCIPVRIWISLRRINAFDAAHIVQVILYSDPCLSHPIHALQVTPTPMSTRVPSSYETSISSAPLGADSVT